MRHNFLVFICEVSANDPGGSPFVKNNGMGRGRDLCPYDGFRTARCPKMGCLLQGIVRAEVICTLILEHGAQVITDDRCENDQEQERKTTNQPLAGFLGTGAAAYDKLKTCHANYDNQNGDGNSTHGAVNIASNISYGIPDILSDGIFAESNLGINEKEGGAAHDAAEHQGDGANQRLVAGIVQSIQSNLSFRNEEVSRWDNADGLTSAGPM